MTSDSERPLSQKVIRGSVWAFSLRFSNRALVLIKTLILARILTPGDFGIYGFALLSISAIDAFSQTGFQTALIQNRKSIDHYLNTAWTALLIRSFALFFLLYAAAPLIAAFFNSPDAAPVIRGLSWILPLSGLVNAGVLNLQKELNLGKHFLIEIVSTSANLVVAIAVALITRSVWAIIWGAIAEHLVKVLLSYAIVPMRPRLELDREKLADLIGFGKWVGGSTILVFLITQGDDIVVGKMLGGPVLGLYQMAFLISNMPATEITTVITRVTLPAYSQLQDDLRQLRVAAYKVIQLNLFLSIPIAGTLFFLSKDITQVLLGEKWLPMVPAMEILCLSGLFRSVNSMLSVLFTSIGKPKFVTKTAAIQLCLLFLLIFPLVKKLGLAGAALSTMIPNALIMLYILFHLVKDLAFDIKKIVMSFGLPLAGAGAALATMQLARSVPAPEVVFLPIALFCGALAYLTTIYLADRTVNASLRKNIGEVFSNLRGRPSGSGSNSRQARL
jgi:O-antigen/teichoic acid export membrane protein